jgi:type II secretory pathway pseudopilin PulG
LVELMTVVAIMGILAAVAVTLVRGHVLAAKTNRALSGAQAILTSQLAFRAEHGQYLDCSPGTLRYYPMLKPDKRMYAWRQTSHLDYARWSALGLPSDGSGTQYGYMMSAGLPSTPYPTFHLSAAPTMPASADPWFVVQFAGDLDGDDVQMRGAATSLNNEVFVENETE